MPQPPGPEARFAETFARSPSRPPRGLVPGRRVWTSLGSGAVLAAATILAVPLLSANVFDGGDAAPVANIQPQLPPVVVDEDPAEEPEEEPAEEEEEEQEEE
nr:hypothetical protein [Vibrio vulnificus]